MCPWTWCDACTLPAVCYNDYSAAPTTKRPTLNQADVCDGHRDSRFCSRVDHLNEIDRQASCDRFAIRRSKRLVKRPATHQHRTPIVESLGDIAVGEYRLCTAWSGFNRLSPLLTDANRQQISSFTSGSFAGSTTEGESTPAISITTPRVQ